MTPVDLLAGALLGAGVVYALVRAIAAVAAADAVAKRMGEVAGQHDNHRERLVQLETTTFADRQLLNKLAKLQGIAREKA